MCCECGPKKNFFFCTFAHGLFIKYFVALLHFLFFLPYFFMHVFSMHNLKSIHLIFVSVYSEEREVAVPCHLLICLFLPGV